METNKGFIERETSYTINTRRQYRQNLIKQIGRHKTCVPNVVYLKQPSNDGFWEKVQFI